MEHGTKPLKFGQERSFSGATRQESPAIAGRPSVASNPGSSLRLKLDQDVLGRYRRGSPSTSASRFGVGQYSARYSDYSHLQSPTSYRTAPISARGSGPAVGYRTGTAAADSLNSPREAALHAQVSDLRDQINTLTLRHEQELDRSRASLNHQTSELDSVTHRLRDAEYVASQERARSQRLEAELSELKGHYEAEIDRLKATAATLTRENDGLRHHIETVSRVEVASLNDRLRASELASERAMESTRAEMLGQIHDLTRTLNSKDDFITSLEQELAALRHRHQATVADSERNVEHLQASMHSSRQLTEVQEVELSKCKKSMSDLRKENRLVIKENGLQSTEIKRLRQENSALLKDLGKLELVVYGKVTKRAKSPRVGKIS